MLSRAGQGPASTPACGGEWSLSSPLRKSAGFACLHVCTDSVCGVGATRHYSPGKAAALGVAAYGSGIGVAQSLNMLEPGWALGLESWFCGAVVAAIAGAALRVLCRGVGLNRKWRELFQGRCRCDFERAAVRGCVCK